MVREIETWLSDSRVGNNSVVNHRSRRPVLSPLHNCVDRCHVQYGHIGRRDASRGGGCSKTVTLADWMTISESLSGHNIQGGSK